MKMKINRGLLPIKIHFFFFFAALGPLLPQMNVFGRQLGVSAPVMGLVTAILPLLWAAAKPVFGYLVDFFPRQRKLVFMLLIVVMSGSYCCLWFLPMPDTPQPEILLESVYELNDTVSVRSFDNETDAIFEKYNCHWNCTTDNKFEVYLSNSTYVNTLYIDKEVTNSSCSSLHMGFDVVRKGEVMCVPKNNCNLMCFEINKTDRSKREITSDINNVTDELLQNIKNVEDGNFYMTATFWAFVILMCIGTVAFNVANCIGDAVCFDMLGPDRGSKYGAQRAWGTAGYGFTALLGGWLVDTVSDTYKDFTPAFIIALVATVVDMASCRALTLPRLSSPDDSGKALRDVLRIPRVMVFITFAVIAGTFDSFIIYYMFWFLEELAEQTGSTAKIKLIEGVVVAAECFVGEILFFFFSGKIIKRWGYGKTMTFSLFCYGVRLALISLIQHPWHLVFIEGIMQGPTYALCYSTIVGYAAHVAPEGYSATVQGIVAGMDDGVGFALGSIVGGQVYGLIGGRSSFRAFAGAALVASAAHALLFSFVTRKSDKRQKEMSSPEADKMLTNPEGLNVTYNEDKVYRPTVVPISGEEKIDR